MGGLVASWDAANRRLIRRNHGATFKEKVALDAVRCGNTLTEFARQCDVHANQIKQWKDPLLSRAEDLFGGRSSELPTPPINVKTLHAKTRELTLANDFLSGALGKVELRSAMR